MPLQPADNRDANVNIDEVIVQEKLLSVGASSNLPTLSGLTFPANATSFVIVPENEDDDIRFALDGPASGTTGRVAANGEWFSMTKTTALTFTLFNSAGGKAVGLRVYGPRPRT